MITVPDPSAFFILVGTSSPSSSLPASWAELSGFSNHHPESLVSYSNPQYWSYWKCPFLEAVPPHSHSFDHLSAVYGGNWASLPYAAWMKCRLIVLGSRANHNAFPGYWSCVTLSANPIAPLDSTCGHVPSPFFKSWFVSCDLKWLSENLCFSDLQG